VLLGATASGCSSDSKDDAGDASTSSASLVPAAGTEKAGDTSTGDASGAKADAGPFTLTSSAFDDGGSMPAAYACDRAGGEGKSPPLAWSGVPDGTERLVLVVHDPDAPLAGGFTHLVTAIPLDITELADGANADTAGPMAKWIPACPPSGEHHYEFTLYAFGPDVDLPGAPDKAAVDAVAGDALGKAELTGLFAAPD
jgi:Raf kinase inhibitor-like YbhB/YbcL family protein